MKNPNIFIVKSLENKTRMLRIIGRSLLRCGETCQVKKSAGIFTSAVNLQDNGSDEVGTGKRQGFEKSLNSVTLLGIFANI